MRMKRKMLAGFLALCMSAMAFVGCADSSTSTAPSVAEPDPTGTESTVPAPGNNNGDKLVVGFAQIGQESGWRDAETQSIQFYAGQNLDTIQLHFADGQGDQANQIKAIKTFIDMGVDVIGVAPYSEEGWDAVFAEAKEAGIPIVLVDRMANVEDESTWATFIGSDFIEEGANAAIEMSRLLDGEGMIVELEGSPGASAANDRKEGFHAELANHPGIEILESQTGHFERAKGKEVMESFLKTYEGQISGVYAHNDDMMLGAIEAIKEAGLQPGVDIVTVSIDGVGGIFEAMIAGEANVTIECNPLLGPQFFDTCWKLKNGESVERWIKSEEDIYRQEDAEAVYPTRVY